MKNVSIVLVSSVVVLTGLYLFFVQPKPTNDSQVQNTINIGASGTSTSTPTNTINVGDNTSTNNTTNGQGASPVPMNNQATNQIKVMHATFHTSKGDITIEFSKDTPLTVSNFVTLVKSGFYDGTKFHRVIKGFVDQGGDPLSKDDTKAYYWGTGGPGYQFKDEIGPNNHNYQGTIAMANSGPDTNGSQFFFNAVENDSLDNKHTVFGKIISGMDVMEAINAVAVDGNNRPLDPVVVISVTVQ